MPFRGDEELLPIKDMDAWGRRTFHVRLVHFHSSPFLTIGAVQAYATLNRLQSIVFPVAYNTNENMLVCAPTGAVSSILINNRIALTMIVACRVKPTSPSSQSSAASPPSAPPHSRQIRPHQLFLPPVPTRLFTSRLSRLSQQRSRSSFRSD